MKPKSSDSSSVLKTFYLVNMCLLTWAESPSELCKTSVKSKNLFSVCLFKCPSKLIFSYISFSRITESISTTVDIKNTYVKTIQDSSNEGSLSTRDNSDIMKNTYWRLLLQKHGVQFQPNLAQNILEQRGSSFVQMNGLVLSYGEIIATKWFLFAIDNF